MRSSDTQMTEEELKQQLKGSLLILSTSSPDKREIYRLMFSSHDKDRHHRAGLDLFFTDSGALGIVPRKTPEQSGHYNGNLEEKARQLLSTLKDAEVERGIRSKLAVTGNEFAPHTVNIMGMVEDSGWELDFKNKQQQEAFVSRITEDLKPKLRKQDYWLLEKLHETGFPGPNLKPLQEHLQGGFNELMEMIYKAAEETGIQDKNLHYTMTVTVCFVSPGMEKIFAKEFKSGGKLLTQEEYGKQLLDRQRGEAINTNSIQVPKGQKKTGDPSATGPRTVDMLIREGLHTKSSNALPGKYARREVVEYLQKLVGKRASSFAERKRPVRIAYVNPGVLDDKEHPLHADTLPPRDYLICGVPTRTAMRKHANLKAFDSADVVVLIPGKQEHTNNHLHNDPNLGLLLNFVVTMETEPEAMSVPLVVDNRSGGFDNALKLISTAFVQGRLMGDTPFYVANNDEALKSILEEIKDFKQRGPLVKVAPVEERSGDTKDPLKKIPLNDGVFTVFVGGGHNNNSKRDMEEAEQFGYFCAKHHWRIVTGAGSLEGSMGAVHTGFVQYYLDELTNKMKTGKRVSAQFKEGLEAFRDPETGRFNAERIIKNSPDLIDRLADAKYIPRDMFYGYSLKPLLELESYSGKPPPGITYIDAGNRVRRLDGLLAPGTKIFLPGSIGTDEEFEETVKQHLAALSRKRAGAANDTFFADGTPDDKGAMLVYNRDRHLDPLLQNYGLLQEDPATRQRREKYGVVIASSIEGLEESTLQRADEWQKRVTNAKAAKAKSEAREGAKRA